MKKMGPLHRSQQMGGEPGEISITMRYNRRTIQLFSKLDFKDINTFFTEYLELRGHTKIDFIPISIL